MSGNLKQIRIALVSIMLFFAASLSAQTVKGTVIDNTGEPVIGASVFEQGVQSNGVATDIDGNFTLTLKGNSKKLKISYIGMKTQIVNVAGKSTVSVKLEDESNSLNDVVVIGYGTVKKKDLTGSVSSISAKDIANVPVSNVSEAMTGKLAGVNITTTEGSPDADIKIRVRGGGSISQDNSPLYIVDGFPVSSISDIAPSEIQTIDVLKDASSTAIYGARGANGVIIITTKSGSEGKTQVNFNASYSWKKVTKFVKTMDPYNYAMYQYETNPTSGEYGNFEDLDIWKSKEGTDYQDELFGRTGHQYQYNVSISGGTKDMKYSVSYARNDENSIMLGSGYTKDNINAKINANLNKWLSMDFNARFANTKINGISGGQDTNAGGATNGIVAQVITYRPVEPINTSGSDDDEENQLSNDRTPLQRINATYKKQIRFQQNYNAGLNWKPFKGWTVRSEFGFGWKYYDTYDIQGADAVKSPSLNGAEQFKPIAYFTYDKTKTWRNANTITYDNKKLFGGRDHINVMIGQEWSSEDGQVHEIGAGNYLASMLPSEIKANMQAGETLMNKTSIDIPDHMLSFFGRLNYTLADKYLATFTLRADGSSRFTNKKWGYFPSIAGAWTVSNEKFWEPIKNAVEYMKIRASYGVIGNQDITPYSTLGLLKTTDFSYGTNQSYTGYWANGLATPDLTWEKVHQFDLGVDFGFFGNRLNVSFDYFNKTTKDALLETSSPGYLGGTTYWVNAGEVNNKGIEATINGQIIQTKDWTWSTTLNVSYLKNKVTKMTASDPIIYGQTPSPGTVDPCTIIKEGEAIGTFYGFKWAGVEKNDKGEYVDMYYTADGNKTADPDASKDRFILGHSNPDVTLGWNNTITYKNWDFNVFCNAAFGAKRLNMVRFAMNSMVGASMFVTDKDYFGNIGITMPTPGAENKTYGNSDKWLENADYFRCENISVAYTFPRSVTKLADIRLSLSAQNLFTITGYKGIDPAGASFGEKNIDRDNGLDMGAYPNPRTITMGVRVTF